MVQRRRYTKREKAQAVGIAAVEGVTEAERQTGIAKNTIQYWTKEPEFVQLRTTAREMVADEFWVGIQIGVREVAQGLTGDAPLNHKSEALKALVEKYLLLTGEATSRIESVSITDGLDDHEKGLLKDAVLGELGRRADARSVVPAVGDPGSEGADTPSG